MSRLHRSETSPVIVRRQLRYQERKLVSDVAATEPLLRIVAPAVGVREDHIYKLARAAQRRGAHLDPGESVLVGEFLRRLMVDAGISHREIVQRAVLARRARIVSH